MFLVNTLVWLFSNALFWVALLIGLSLVIKKSRIKNTLRNTGIVLFLILSNNGLCDLFYRALECQTLVATDISEPYDIGIVLGPFLFEGKNFPNGEEIIKYEHPRFFHARQLYSRGKFKRFLLSGNNNPGLAREYLISLGVPAADILIESASRNTYENAFWTKSYLDQNEIVSNKLLLITSAYHMRRAKKCFEKVGLDVTPFNVDHIRIESSFSILNWIVPNVNAFEKWSLLLREWGATLFFKFGNYI